MKAKNTTLTKLAELAGIRSGHPFRGKVENTPADWDVYVLQLKDVQRDCHIDLSKSAKVKMTDEKQQPLQPGDILIRARGGYYYSGLFTFEEPNVIAASQFFVITPNIKKIIPAYLCWYLNQPTAQQYLERSDTGTNIPMINKTTISDLPVTLPSLATQEKIAEIHQGWLKEKSLTEKLLNNRERMMRGMCQQFINQDLCSLD